MLVLSRRKDEAVVVHLNTTNPKTGKGEEVQIVITVVDIRGDKVRLGIEAPTYIPVHREEVWNAIKRSEQARRE